MTQTLQVAGAGADADFATWEADPIGYSRAMYEERLVENLPASKELSPLLQALQSHRKLLADFLRARCRGWADESDVEDILQELWIRISKIEDGDVQDPKSYLFRAAHNIMFDRARSQSVRHAYEADWSYVRHMDVVEDGIENAMLARERLAFVNRVLHSVGERAALIFRRYQLDGVPQKNIASELAVSLSTVEKDLKKTYNALLSIKEAVDEE